MNNLRPERKLDEMQIAKAKALDAESRLKYAVRAAASNLLRVVAGAGKDTEIIDSLAEVAAAYNDLKAFAGTAAYPYTPSSAMADGLRDLNWRASEADRQPTADDLARWERDGTSAVRRAESRIVQQSMRIVAAQLMRQMSQESNAQNDLHRVIAEYTGAVSSRQAGQARGTTRSH